MKNPMIISVYAGKHLTKFSIPDKNSQQPTNRRKLAQPDKGYAENSKLSRPRVLKSCTVSKKAFFNNCPFPSSREPSS